MNEFKRGNNPWHLALWIGPRKKRGGKRGGGKKKGGKKKGEEKRQLTSIPFALRPAKEWLSKTLERHGVLFREKEKKGRGERRSGWMRGVR